MASEIQRIREPGKLERMREFISKPLSEKLCDEITSSNLKIAAVSLSIGLMNLSFPLIYFGLNVLSLNEYLVRRAKHVYDTFD